MLSQVLIKVVGLRFAAVAETCDHDLTSALQTHSQAVRHSVADASVSQVDRVLEAIRNTATDAEVICVSAEEGEEAPFPGTFTPASGHKVEVGVGHTAPESGEYCVQNSLVSLMQRATIDGQAGNFEAVVAGKGAEKSTRGKNSRRRSSCGGASNLCKVNVKVRRKPLPIDDLCQLGRPGVHMHGQSMKTILRQNDCKDVAQLDAVCKSDCTMTCAEVLKGRKAQRIQTMKTMLKNGEGGINMTEERMVEEWFRDYSDLACCKTDGASMCLDRFPKKNPEVSGVWTMSTMTQQEAWKMIAEEHNNRNTMTDTCTAQMVGDSCK